MRRAAKDVPAAAPAWFDTAGVLARYPLSRATLARRVEDGTFPRPVKLGSRVLWSAAELDAFERRLLADREAP